MTQDLKPVHCLLILATSAVAVNFPDSLETFIFSDGEPRGGRQAELESSSRWRAAPCPGGASWCEEASDYPGLITIEEQVAAVDFIRSRIFSEERPKNLDAVNTIFGSGTTEDVNEGEEKVIATTEVETLATEQPLPTTTILPTTTTTTAPTTTEAATTTESTSTTSETATSESESSSAVSTVDIV